MELPVRRPPARLVRRALRALALLLWLACGGWLFASAALAQAAPQIAPELAQQVRQLALDASVPAASARSPRVEVEVGQLDPRLRLAPCERVESYLPAGARAWGRTRVGLRCAQGAARWNVWLPITVKVFGPAWVARTGLAAGTVLAAGDLVQAEIDLAEEASTVVGPAQGFVGRALAQPLRAGQGLRQSHLKARQWFAAGETVQVLARRDGFSIGTEGQAITPGVEGQSARVRTESGRILTGQPVGDRRMEVVW
jgi:flagellar basal body P-ring formation protein FlgA